MEKTHLKFAETHPRVKAWLKDRPVGTQIRYGTALMHFCEALLNTIDHVSKLFVSNRAGFENSWLLLGDPDLKLYMPDEPTPEPGSASAQQLPEIRRPAPPLVVLGMPTEIIYAIVAVIAIVIIAVLAYAYTKKSK